MKLRHTLLAAALCCAATAAIAAPSDPRISTRPYDPDKVVLLEGRAGVQATIMFGDLEQIENVAIGDSNSWQVTPNKRANLLFVKPLGDRARTNMTVVTDRHTYLFDLAAGPAAAPLYVLRFTYPNEPKPAERQLTGLTAEEALAAASPPKDAQANPAELNFAWRADGDRKILPARIYDDGDATYLSWPAGSAIPAILTRNAKGEEGAVNYAVRGEVMILDSVPKTIVLRSGRSVATLENQHPPEAAVAASAETETPQTTPAEAKLAAAAIRPEGR